MTPTRINTPKRVRNHSQLRESPAQILYMGWATPLPLEPRETVSLVKSLSKKLPVVPAERSDTASLRLVMIHIVIFASHSCSGMPAWTKNCRTRPQPGSPAFSNTGVGFRLAAIVRRFHWRLSSPSFLGRRSTPSKLNAKSSPPTTGLTVTTSNACHLSRPNISRATVHCARRALCLPVSTVNRNGTDYQPTAQQTRRSIKPSNLLRKPVGSVAVIVDLLLNVHMAASTLLGRTPLLPNSSPKGLTNVSIAAASTSSVIGI